MSGGGIGIGIAVWSLALWTAGCGGGSTEHPDPAGELERLRGRAPEDVAGTVDGRTVGIDLFDRQWQGRPELERRALVEEVVRREVTVQRAIESGFHRESSLGPVRKRGLVRALLRRKVEQAVGPEDVEESEIERRVEKLRAELGRPAGIRATHLLVMPGSREAVSGGDRVGSEAERAEAREWVEQIRKELGDRASVTDLFDTRRAFRDRIPEEFEVSVDAHLEFPSPASREFEGRLPDGWIEVVEPFAARAHRMLREGRTGEISEPVESPFGWHLIRPESRLAATVPDREAAREVAVSKGLRQKRRERFDQLWEKWKTQSSIAMDPSALEGRVR